jgi:hypothetical protein
MPNDSEIGAERFSGAFDADALFQFREVDRIGHEALLCLPLAIARGVSLAAVSYSHGARAGFSVHCGRASDRPNVGQPPS